MDNIGNGKMTEPVKLVTAKPDTEIATELKAELVASAEAWLAACTKANKAGFKVAANFGPNYLGIYTIQALQLIKEF